MGNVTIQTAVVPEGTCPPWIIDLWPELVALLEANLNGTLNTFNYGSSTPDPENEDKPWLKLDMNGFPDGQYWVFKDGNWLKEHPIPPGIVTMWEGDITAIDTFDGGETGVPVTLTTGPMWEVVAGMAAKFPLGTGTLPSGSVIAVGTTGGEETHELVTEEMPEHSHVVFARSADTESGTGVTRLAPDIANPDTSYGSTGLAGGDVAHNNMPPYYGIHFIKRTGRTMYRA